MVRVRVDNDRAIAASLVSPVSTGPLLSSPMACLASPISANPRWTPTQGPKPHRCHVETCEMAANSAKILTSPFFQANDYSLASITCEGCGLQD